MVVEPRLYVILASFAAVGGGVKLVDDAFDESRFSRELATILALVVGGVMGYAMFANEVAATVLGAIIAGTLLTGKIDNPGHIVTVVVTVSILAVFGVELQVVPFVAFTVAGISDEIGNDIADRYWSRISELNVASRFFVQFFEYRCTLKLAVLGAVIAGIVPGVAIGGLLLFDISYELTGKALATIAPSEWRTTLVNQE